MNNYINCRYFAQILTSIVIVIVLIDINWNLLYRVIPYSPVPNVKGPEIGHHYTCGWSRSSTGKCRLPSCTCRIWSYFWDRWMIFAMPVYQIMLLKITNEIYIDPIFLRIYNPKTFQHTCHLVRMSVYCELHDISEQTTLTWLTLNGGLNSRISCSCREIMKAK